MEKQLKNEVLTLGLAILLLLVGVLLLLGALDVHEFFDFTLDVLEVFAGAFLLAYAVLVLLPLVERYGGTARYFAIGEMGLCVLLALGKCLSKWFAIPLLAGLSVCASIGFVIWMRGVTEAVHTYLRKGAKSGERGSLARLCAWLLVLSFGLWQVARPSVKDKDFLLCLAILFLIGALFFGYLTYRNHNRSGKK